jgi:hypothetical protein
MERDDKDYAIEFGEYLAKAAREFMEAHNDIQRAQMLSDFGAATEAEARVTEAWRSLEGAIYEFRKRATRAGHEPSAVEFCK